MLRSISALFLTKLALGSMSLIFLCFLSFEGGRYFEDWKLEAMYERHCGKVKDGDDR